MRSLRWIPPVRSPISLKAILAGLSAATREGYASRTLRIVEDVLHSRYGTSVLVLTESGTSALSLALRGTVKRGSAALPAYGCYDLATAVDSAGVPFVLYDIDPSTLGPDWHSLRRALEAGADRIVVVHLYGIPVDMRRVRALAAEFDATVIEDAAQGAGGKWMDSPLGAAGSLGVLSFGRGKGMTGGRGGALLGIDGIGKDTVGRIRALPLANTTAGEVLAFVAQWIMSRPYVYGIPASVPYLRLGETTYHAPSTAKRASHFSVGALSRTVNLVDIEATFRRMNAERLKSSLDGDRLRSVAVPPEGVAGYLRLPVIASAAACAFVRGANARMLGVMPGYPTSLASLAGFGKRRDNALDEMPGAELLADRLITLPTHGALSERDLARLEDWCRSHH